MNIRFAVLLATVLGVTTLVLASPGGVSAHAEYESSTPGRNEVVPQSPTQVDVTFTQEVTRQDDRSAVRVFNEAEVQVSEGAGVVDDVDRTHISAVLQPNLPAGLYVVRWTTLSFEDGDDDEGAFCFYIQSQPTAAQQETCAAFDEGEEPTGTASGATATLAAEPTDSNGRDDDDDSGNNTGAIVGLIIAVAVVAGGILFLVRRSRA
jgi:methionine-rich copper-binding protein CopC